MKFKLLASSVLMAGALMGSGSASAYTDWYWTGSLSDWATNGGIVDSNPPSSIPPLVGTGTSGVGSGDGDTTFTFLNSTFDHVYTPAATVTTVTLTEEEIGGRDIYNVGLGWTLSQHSGIVGYSVSSDEINQVALDSVISVSGNVSKYLYSTQAAYNTAVNTGNYSIGAFLTQHSVDGSHDPVGGGLTDFTNIPTVWVLDVINSGNIKDIHNEFSVPEPTTMIMLGLGLAAFGYSRRNTKGLAA